MYARILVATDGSDLAGRALDHALQLARMAASEVVIVTITEPALMAAGSYAAAAGAVFDPMPEVVEAQQKAANDLLAAAARKAEAAGIKARTVLVENSFPSDGIIATANEIGAELIVMGSHGRAGLGRLLLGSQTNNVLAHSKIPVLVTR
ncbi:universal stress protein [Devosia sp.]|uniref:universal stress protein n=1 Tax=Devosia sp. TaxID=1871048 RepID=UPI0035B378E4